MGQDESYDKHAEVITPIWGGLAAIHRKPGSPRRLRIRWVRMLGSIVGLTAIFWLMIALALYFWFKLGRGFENEKFGDVLGLPFHWPPFHSVEHDKNMGDFFYKKAELDLKYRHLEEAFNDYHIALMKTPENLDAREIYAEFSKFSNKNLDSYFAILEDGIPYALTQSATPVAAVETPGIPSTLGNPNARTLAPNTTTLESPRKVKPEDYLNTYFVNLIQAQIPDRTEHIEKICQLYLAQNPSSRKIRDIFALNLMNAYIDEGNEDSYKLADGIFNKYELEKTPDGVLLKSRLYWERGELHTAVKYLEQALQKFGYSDYFLGLISLYYRDLGDLDKSVYYTILRAQSNPGKADPLIDLLYDYVKKGDRAGVAHNIEDIIKQFGTDARAMTLLANFATDQGDIELALRLYQLAQNQDRQLRLAAKESDFNVASFALLATEAYLTKSDYKGAINFLDQIRDQKPDWFASKRVLFDSLRGVADYALGQETEAEMYVENLITSTTTDPYQLLLVANRYLSHDGAPLAQRLLVEANRMDPHNQAILAQLISTNLQLGFSENMDKNIHNLLLTRHPPDELLYDAYRQLASDHFIFVPDREKLLAELGQFLTNAAKNHSTDN